MHCLLIDSLIYRLIFQADATHERIVKREEGEKLAKVCNVNTHKHTYAVILVM